MGGLLLTGMAPPCCSTIFLQITNPKNGKKYNRLNIKLIQDQCVKKLNAFFLGILLLAFSATTNPLEQSYAISPIEEQATLKKQLVENSIIDALDTVADEKSVKKIENAQKQFEKGNLDFDNENFKKAIKHYDNSLKQIQKALKELHAKKMKVTDQGAGDISGDELDDIHIKIKNPGTSKKPIKVDLKIKDSCVNGITAEEAGMKIAFMGPGLFIVNERLTDEGFDVTSKWFKKNDENKQIDRFTEIFTFFSLPPSGDNMIQKNQKNQGSFEHNEIGISEIGGQTGWEGSFEIKGNPGDYEMVLFFKVTDVGVQDDCDLISAITIPINIAS